MSGPAPSVEEVLIAENVAIKRQLRTLRRVVVRMLAGGMVALMLGLLWVYFQSYEGRVSVVETQRLGCVRGELDRAEAIMDELDDAAFRRSAARARERAGSAADLKTAKSYRRMAARAEARAKGRKTRLLGADLALVSQRFGPKSGQEGAPTPAAVKEARRACRIAFPSASPWPWVHPRPARL